MAPSYALDGRQVVFLASIDWDAVWQRHQALATAFAEAGHEVFFVENTGFRGLRWSDAGRVAARLSRVRRPRSPRRNPHGRVQVVSPVVLPPVGAPARAINRAFWVPRLLERLKGIGLREGALVFAYLPTATTLQLLDGLRPSRVVYDCVDNFHGHPTPPKDLDATEGGLLRRAALVLTTSPFLTEKQRAKHPRVHELHHGVGEAFFRASRAPAEYRRLCYFGTIWNVLDYAAIRALAEDGFEVTLLGAVKEPPPALPSSVRLPGPVPASDLPAALDAYDAFLLPYADVPYNRGVTPAKTYECLATGKPTLASPIPGLASFGDHFYTAAGPADWSRLARELPRLESAARREARIALAKDHTTRAQFARLRRLLAD